MTIIGQSVNAVVATMLWTYFASIAILAGGELNARRLLRRTPDVALDEDEPHFATQPAPVGAATRGDGYLASDERDYQTT